jgi:hypothetical protein
MQMQSANCLDQCRGLRRSNEPTSQRDNEAAKSNESNERLLQRQEGKKEEGEVEVEVEV